MSLQATADGFNWDFLGQGWFQTLLWILGTILSIALGYWFYKGGKPKNELEYLIGDSLVIDRNGSAHLSDRMALTFDGIEVPRVTITSIGFWNSGSTLIDGPQLGTSKPLKVVVTDDVRVLDCSIVAMGRDVTEATIAPKGSSQPFRVGFSYLDPGDGFIVQVLHTGENGNCRVEGHIKGLPTGPKNRLSKKPYFVGDGRFATIALAVIMISMLFQPQLHDTSSKIELVIVTVVTTVQLLAMAFLCYSIWRGRRMRAGVPSIVRSNPVTGQALLLETGGFLTSLL